MNYTLMYVSLFAGFLYVKSDEFLWSVNAMSLIRTVISIWNKHSDVILYQVNFVVVMLF